MFLTQVASEEYGRNVPSIPLLRISKTTEVLHVYIIAS